MTSPERLAGIALACLVEPGTAGVAEIDRRAGGRRGPLPAAHPARAPAVVGRLDPDDVPGDAGRDVPTWGAGRAAGGARVPQPAARPARTSAGPVDPGPPGPAGGCAALGRGRRGPGLHRLRRARHGRPGRGTGRGRLGRGLRRGVRDRRGCASGGPGGRRPDRRRPRLRRRRGLPPGPRRPAVPDRRLRAGRLRAAPGQPAAQAPIPRPQPGDRRAEPGHGRGRGRAAQRCGVHRLPGPRARPGRHGRARPGHVDGQLRDQPAAARAGGPRRQ